MSRVFHKIIAVRWPTRLGSLDHAEQRQGFTRGIQVAIASTWGSSRKLWTEGQSISMADLLEGLVLIPDLQTTKHLAICHLFHFP